MEKELLIEKIKRYSIGYEHGNWYVVKYYYWERERIPDEYVKEEWFQMEVICKNPLMMRYFGDTVLRKIWETLVDYSRGDELYYTRIVNAIEYILRHEKEDGAEKNIGRLIDAGIIKVLCDKGNKVVKQYVSDNPQISDRVEIMGSIVYAIESVEKGNPAAFKQLCDYARKGVQKAIDYIVDHIDNDECWQCFAEIALVEEKVYTQIESVIDRNWSGIFQLADNGDENAQKIVLRYKNKDENEVYSRAVLWAKAGNPVAKNFVLEYCSGNYIRELADHGDIDALKCLAILGDKDAINKMVAMGDWETIKGAAVQSEQKKTRMGWRAIGRIVTGGTTYALGKLVKNERIKEIEEVFPTSGIKLIEIIDQLGKLETVKNATADNSMLQDAITKYCRCKMKTVEIRSVVSVQDCATKRVSSYCIVAKKKDSFSHDVPQIQEVPVETPLGKALYGKKVGEIVRFRAATYVEKKYEIIDIN